MSCTQMSRTALCTAQALRRLTTTHTAAFPSTSTRSFHSSRIVQADPAPKAATGGKVAGGGAKKKKEVAVAAPMHVPKSMSEYEFSFLNVFKEYKAPDEKVVLRPDAAYPNWIWDQTPEPTWSDLLLADFNSLPPTYQKKIFSIPRKAEIKRKNELSKKS